MSKSIEQYIEVARALAKVPGVTQAGVAPAKGNKWCIHYVYGAGVPSWIGLAQAKAIVRRGHL